MSERDYNSMELPPIKSRGETGSIQGYNTAQWPDHNDARSDRKPISFRESEMSVAYASEQILEPIESENMAVHAFSRIKIRAKKADEENEDLVQDFLDNYDQVYKIFTASDTPQERKDAFINGLNEYKNGLGAIFMRRDSIYF